MRFTLLGVRGSRPVDPPGKMYFGGNTTAFRVDTTAGVPIFVDCGTGLYVEGERLAREGGPLRAHVLLTHTHWDHVLALPRFRPLYDARSHLTFHASTTERATFRQLFEGQHHDLCFTVPVAELDAHIDFAECAPDRSFRIGDVRVRTYQLNHPGVTLGYRIEADDRAVCVVTDTAPIEGNWLGQGMPSAAAPDPRRFESQFEDGLVRLLEGADLVIYDTHFTPAGLRGRRHWGHSTPQDAVAMCLRAGARWVVLHHHAPGDDDDAVRAKLRAARTLAGPALRVSAAREGEVLCP